MMTKAVPDSRYSPLSARDTVDSLRVVMTGHVDHGKSTVLGRLLLDAGAVADEKVAQVRAACAAARRPFEYSFLLDALKDERAQGITIDAARAFLATAHRRYTLTDAPGHAALLTNMVTGASQADVAVLVIDASEGIRETSRRHAYLLSFLGVRQVIVLINKMDLLDYSQAAFEQVANCAATALNAVSLAPLAVIPACAQSGENIGCRGGSMRWYQGQSLMEALTRVSPGGESGTSAFRMPVQGVYCFGRGGNAHRIVAGTVRAGYISVGDPIRFMPSGERSRVRSIEGFNTPTRASVRAGDAVGFTLTDDIYAARGQIAVRGDEAPPLIASHLRAAIFWLSRAPMTTHRDYLLKLGTASVQARVKHIGRVFDPSSLTSSDRLESVECHEAAECELRLTRPIAFDRASDVPETGRFVLVGDGEICGGGVVLAALAESRLRTPVIRNAASTQDRVSGVHTRPPSHSSVPTLLCIMSEVAADGQLAARALEKHWSDEPAPLYVLAVNPANASPLASQADSDTVRRAEQDELVRQTGIAAALLSAGHSVVMCVPPLEPEQHRIMCSAAHGHRCFSVAIGDVSRGEAGYALRLPRTGDAEEHASAIRPLLLDHNVTSRSC